MFHILLQHFTTTWHLPVYFWHPVLHVVPHR